MYQSWAKFYLDNYSNKYVLYVYNTNKYIFIYNYWNDFFTILRIKNYSTNLETILIE
jgi:hypothetical protein